MASLREALARVVSDQRRDPDSIVDDIDTTLRDPDYRLAILNFIGDVREGVIYDSHHEEGYWTTCIRRPLNPDVPTVFLVRPRAPREDESDG